MVELDLQPLRAKRNERTDWDVELHKDAMIRNEYVFGGSLSDPESEI